MESVHLEMEDDDLIEEDFEDIFGDEDLSCSTADLEYDPLITEDLVMALTVTTVAVLTMSQSFSQIVSRAGNTHYDRSYTIKFIRSWDDQMFHRQTRLVREDFYGLVNKLIPILEKNAEMGRRSSGSPISAELKLAITCRILAGAETLDMIWYSVSVDHVKEIVYETCRAIGKVLHNVNFPHQNKNALREMSHQWDEKQRTHLGCVPIPGIGMAGDGFLVKIQEPNCALDPNIYRNRKGYFALLCQAFCDANCSFKIFEMKWPGGTNDVTAYQQTKLYDMMTNGT